MRSLRGTERHCRSVLLHFKDSEEIMYSTEWAFAPFALDLPEYAVTKFSYFGSFVSDFPRAVRV